MIIYAIKRIDEDYYVNFRKKYPKLDEIETVICLMIILNFRDDEISCFVKKMPNTIRQMKVDIRKKLNIKLRADIKKSVEDDFRKIKEPIFKEE
jgi:hypothetical protein